MWLDILGTICWGNIFFSIQLVSSYCLRGMRLLASQVPRWARTPHQMHVSRDAQGSSHLPQAQTI